MALMCWDNSLRYSSKVEKQMEEMDADSHYLFLDLPPSLRRSPTILFPSPRGTRYESPFFNVIIFFV